MPAKLIEFTNREGIDPAVIERVEDRYPVRRQRDRTGKKRRLRRDRLRGSTGLSGIRHAFSLIWL
jgi:hypothetical protein